MSRRPWSLGKLASTWTRRNGGSDDTLLHASILSDLVGERAGPPGRVDDVKRVPAPSARPEPHAQWNEISGRWERWDTAANEWLPVPEDLSD